MIRGVASPGDLPRPQTPRELQAVIAAERSREPFLLLRDAAGEQVIHSLGRRSQLTVGRGAEHVLRLDWDDEVSRTHAELRRLGEEWVVADDGLSSNGTFVNGDRITGDRRLRDGDMIRCGRTSLAFRAPDAGAATAPPRAGAVPSVGELTATQRGVLIALCRPLAGGAATPATNPEIAREVHLSVEAVKDHMRVLFRKFGLADLPQFEKRTRLADDALRWGAVTERELRGG